MSRPLRLEFAGALYHVTSRGDRQEDIYENDADRISFLKLLGDVCGNYKGGLFMQSPGKPSKVSYHV